MKGKIKGVRFGTVEFNNDECDAGRIKVKIHPEDSSVKNYDDLEYAFPLLPKFMHIIPKVGEAVLVLLSETNDGNTQRYYIGPIITQEQFLYYESHLNATAYQKGGFTKFKEAPSMDPKKEGALPPKDDIVIRGRGNSEIQFTENDIRIKAGCKRFDSQKDKQNSGGRNFIFNESNPSYIKLKYHDTEDNPYSTATIVADRINLIGNRSTDPKVETVDRKDLITDKELQAVYDEAYKLPYGEKLVKLLTKMIEVFNEHTHEYNMLPPNGYFIEKLQPMKAELLDNEKLLSDSIRIN